MRMEEKRALQRSTRGMPEMRLERRRDLSRIRHGVYVNRDEWDAAPWWQRYRMRVEAFRVVWPEAVLSHESAAVVHGLPLFTEPRFIHVLHPGRSQTGGHGDVRKHVWKEFHQIVGTDLGLVTSIADTAIDVARSMNAAHALAVWDAALRAGVTAVELAGVMTQHNTKRGRRVLEWVSGRATALGESPAESVSRALIEWLGFPPPKLQATFSTPEGNWRSDMYWQSPNVLGEFDGYGKYSQGRGLPTDALRREKQREDSLRRAGFRIARWEFEHLRNPNRLSEVLKRSGVSPVGPPDTASLSNYLRGISHPR